MTHKLQLLGVPLLQNPSGSLKLERKAAAVLAYLALEGSTHKYKLAGWLWPDSGEDTARNNMRQLLRRLRMAAGEVVLGEDRIELSPEVETDVKQLSYLETPSLEVLQQASELLSDLSYDDAPDFEEWLQSAKEELSELRSRTAKNEAERLERIGNHKQALAYAEVWTRLEPLSEEAHRQVIRLHYLLGDRGAALAAFERIKRILQDELQTQPLSETLELVRLIERGGELLGAVPKPKETLLPTAVLRPPVLAGREREWALLEEAWRSGKIILVSGEPGIGKTRLVEDFAASKGSSIRLDGRPGDTGVPYASQARVMRQLLARKPELNPRSSHLEPWIWSELARLLPELGETPARIQDADRLRFFEACAQVFAYCTRDLKAVIVDDFQFYDDQTIEMAVYYQAQPYAQAAHMPPHLTVFRKGDLSRDKQSSVDQLVEAGMASLIELEPLSGEAIGVLLEALPESSPSDMAQALKRFTGGNPLFILETLKDLIESGGLQQGLSTRFTPPGKVLTLINRRLGRLSPLALNLSRVAAVARTQFTLELAGVVLQRPAMELAQAHAELEDSQILRGNAFSHDLVFEAAQANIPAAVKQVLNAQTAQYLEGREANPALIAQHWEEAKDGDKTAHWLIKAAMRASALGLYMEELELLERAIGAATSKVLRLEAQAMLSDTLGPLGRVEESINLAHLVLREADDPKLKQRALSVLQNMYQGIGRYEEAERFITQALELAEQVGEHDRADGMRFARARILRATGRYAEAAGVLESILPRYQSGPSMADLIQILTALGNTYNLLGQHAAAEPLLREAFALRETTGPALQILAVSNLLYGLICQGSPEELLGEAEAALNLGAYAIADHLRNNLALAYLRLGQQPEAIAHYWVLAAGAFDPNYRAIAWARLAGLLEGAEAVEKAKDLYPQAKTPAARFTTVQAALLYGTVSQKIWGQQELEGLEPDTLPWLLRSEYEALLTEHQNQRKQAQS